MIHLATEPTARSPSYRPVQDDGKGSGLQARPGRSGHAWPFPSRYTSLRPSQPQSQKPTASDSGS